jgi:very-short-patch-repair endonuclease
MAGDFFTAREDVGENWKGWAPLSSGLGSVLDRLGTAYELTGVCESPIEVMFGAAAALIIKSGHPDLSLVPQYRLDRYRYDWAICNAAGRPLLFVECDGAEYHSTLEQRANDTTKDLRAAAAGISLLRFSGRDINRHADACARIAIARALEC